MVKDDLHLLMFKVLAYLYECMKGGKHAERECFKAENGFFVDGISQAYLDEVCLILQREGYADGFKAVKTWSDGEIIVSYDAKITLAGFEYLKENSAMKKVYRYLKEAKDWVPIF